MRSQGQGGPGRRRSAGARSAAVLRAGLTKGRERSDRQNGDLDFLVPEERGDKDRHGECEHTSNSAACEKVPAAATVAAFVPFAASQPCSTVLTDPYHGPCLRE